MRLRDRLAAVERFRDRFTALPAINASATENDRVWAQLYVRLGADGANVADLLG